METAELNAKINQAAKSIFSFCAARTGSRQEAEDLAQDILCELVKTVPNLRNTAAFYGFMWGVAENTYRQWCKKRKRERAFYPLEDIADKNANPLQALEAASDIACLRRELSLLSEKYRRAAVLYYLHGKSCLQIAGKLSVSESMVKYLLFKARKILKEGMKMERNYGEQSYNPKDLNLLYMGEGPNPYWNLLEGNKMRQNILWACYNDKLPAEEISLQIGVALPYMENDLKTLTEAGLLKKDGFRFQTNIIILTQAFEQEKGQRLLPLQKEIAKTLRDFIDEKEKEIRQVAFQGAGMSQNALKWHMVTMLLFSAYQETAMQFFAENAAPKTPFGQSAYIWGREFIEGGFNCCHMSGQEWNTDISLYFMDWLARPDILHTDFYGQAKWVKVYRQLAYGLLANPNEYEEEVLAEMLRKGYVTRAAGKLEIAMPVYSKAQYSAMKALQGNTYETVCYILQKMHTAAAGLLTNHIPPHLKKQAAPIAAMGLFQDGAYKPALQLAQAGYISPEWVPGEVATAYLVKESL